MRNAEAIRRRINEVKQLSSEDAQKALILLSEISFDIGMDACDEREELRLSVKQLRSFIVGNGDPSNSMMARLANVETCLADFSKEIKSDMKFLKDAILGDINTGKRGLYNQVEANTKLNANINKLMWAIILIITGELVGRYLGLF